MNIWYGCISKTWAQIIDRINANSCTVIEPINSNNTCVLFPEIRQVQMNSGVIPPRKVNRVNNSSVVYKMEFNGKSMILPGDLEKEGFDTMTNLHCCRYPLYECNYYCVSHHGSITGHVNIPCRSIRRNVLLCVGNNLQYSILMGRNNAYPGIYSPKVLNDFNRRLIRTDNSRHYVELDWINNSYSMM